MKKQKYVLRSTERYGLEGPRIDAQEVGETLETIPAKLRTPHTVLKMAEDKKSPLHKYFQWDDAAAAHKYRLSQAGKLISLIGIEQDNGEVVPGFISLSVTENQNERSYFSADKVEASDSLRSIAIERIIHEMLLFRARHGQFKAYFGTLFDAIDETEKAWREQNEKRQELPKGKRAGGKRKAD